MLSMSQSSRESLQDIFDKLQRGDISRRQFMQRASALGMGGAAAMFLSRAQRTFAQGATPGASPVAGEAAPLALAEIATNPGSEQADADPEATLTINLGAEIDTGDPQVLAFLNEIEISSKVYTPLLALNEENLPAAAGAESVTVSADGRIYTFTIREGMTYSDGVPVTAQNYAYAIKRALSPVVAGNYSNTLYAVTGGQAWREADPAGDAAELQALEDVVSESIKALDDRTLQISLDFAAGYFPYVMAIWVTYPVREDLVGDDLDWWRDIANYVGNGPFKVTSHTEGEEWVFERNESYFRGVPGIRTLVFKMIESSETELLAYQQGEFDTMGPGGSQLPQIEADPTLSAELQRSVGASTNWFSMNNAAAPFDIVEVRQAFAAALNREQYVNQITNGVGIPAGTLLYPGNPAYQEDYQQTFDEAAAQQFLADGGFPGGEGFPAQQLFYVADDAASQQQATFFAENLNQVLNVQIEPTPIDEAQLQSLRTNRDPSLIFATGNWFEDYPHPQNWLSLVFGPGTTRAPLGWDDPTFNDLVTQADQLPIEEAIPLYQQADAYLAEQAPVAFFRHGENLILIKPNVLGYVTYPTTIFDTVYQIEKIYKTAG
jgi:oligopeptide transport system substrate-binding protein